ncbi:MAG: hypothetical protein AB1487_11075, partial [Thermodesulfobacteriota bacterium]
PYLLISYHISHPFFKDGGQFTIPFSSGNYNCRQAGVLIVAHHNSLHGYILFNPYRIKIQKKIDNWIWP